MSSLGEKVVFWTVGTIMACIVTTVALSSEEVKGPVAAVYVLGLLNLVAWPPVLAAWGWHKLVTRKHDEQ